MKQKTYTHYYKKEILGTADESVANLTDSLKLEFPNLRARVANAPIGKGKSLLYQISNFMGGLNEFDISSTKYETGYIEKHANEVIESRVMTTGIFGDSINRKLKRTLENFGLKEDFPSTNSTASEKINEMRAASFDVIYADNLIERTIEEARSPRFMEAIIKLEQNPGYSFYVETMLGQLAKKNKLPIKLERYDKPNRLRISRTD